MSDSSQPIPPAPPRRVSAFGSAVESSDVTAEITYRDVMEIRPSLSRAEAEAILRAHSDRIGEQMLTAGLLVLIACLTGRSE